MNKRLGKRDLIILGVLAVIFIAVLAGFKLFSKTGAEVVVSVGGKEYGRYPLDQDAEIDIDALGYVSNKLIIKDGVADMIEADCPDQLCVYMSEISKNNEMIVCLPNEVIVYVENGEDAALDNVAK